MLNKLYNAIRYKLLGTDQALIDSIEHWEDNLIQGRYQNINVHSESCALCDDYCTGWGVCYGCPVKEHTGKHSCKNSPWRDASIALGDWRRSHRYNHYVMTVDVLAARQRWRDAAKKELNFLKSLV